MFDVEVRRGRSLNHLAPWSVESLAGLAAIASFYAGEFDLLRLMLQIVVIATVGIGLFRDFGRPMGYPSGRSGRSFAVYLIVMAITGMCVSFAASIMRGISFNDFGLFILQVVVAGMILLSRRRSELALAVGNWAVAFAVIDLVANLLGVAGILEIRTTARQIDGLIVYAYPGLTGNTLSAGFVAFAAVCRVALFASQRGKGRWVAYILILLLVVSLHLIGARRYLGLALVGIVMFLAWKPIARVGSYWVALSVGALFLWLTVNAGTGDAGNFLRRQLWQTGIDRAGEHLVVGRGPTYLDLTNRNATYDELAEVGVTESQLLDFAISYGALSAIFLLTASLIALSRRSAKDYKFHIIALTCLTAELFFGGSLSSFAGTLLFYGALGACLQEFPRRQSSRAKIRTNPRLEVT